MGRTLLFVCGNSFVILVMEFNAYVTPHHSMELKWLVNFFIVVSSFAWPSACVEISQPSCQRSGGAFCSAGKWRRGHIGLLDTAAQLRDALKATAFQNEIIIFAESRISEASQTVARLMGSAGYGHVLPLLNSLTDCAQMVHVLAHLQEERGSPSCGAYTSSEASGWQYPFKLRYFATGMAGSPTWWLKWFTAARAVALGYNVMAIDSDVVVLDDWYWRVKQPPLSDYHMLSQAESSASINGGFTYVQNAAPDGPVAWILYEAMFRLVRWSEDPSVVANASLYIAQAKNIPVDDQTLITDAMLSCMAGRPVFMSLVNAYRFREGEEAAFKTLGMNHWSELQRNIHALASGWDEKEYTVTGPLARFACELFRNGSCGASTTPWVVSGAADGSGVAATAFQTALPPAAATANAVNVTIRGSTLRMPHSGGEWPLSLGGYPFVQALGPHAVAYREAFAELGVRLPPDPEDPATEAAARAIPPERFGLLNLDLNERYSGSWAESSWWTAGRHGYWHSHLWPQPAQPADSHAAPPAPPPALLPQAIGHVFAGLWPGAFQKTLALQLAGLYDWRVASRVAGSPFRVFHTSPAAPEGAQQHPSHHSYLSDIRLVVAYSPDAVPQDLGREQFVRAAQGLAQVAVALGAVAAWPAAPCMTPWVTAKPEGANTDSKAARPPPPPPRHSIPWTYLNTAYAVQPFGDTLEELQCEWLAFSDEGCILPERDGSAHFDDEDDGSGGGSSSSSSSNTGLGGGRALFAVEFHYLRAVLGHRVNDTESAPAAADPKTGGDTATAKPFSRGAHPKRRRRLLQPTASTTLRLFKPESNAGRGSEDLGRLLNPKYDDLVHLNADLLLSSLRRDVPTVIWLDRLVGSVKGLPDEAGLLYDRWYNRCRALRFFDLTEGERSVW